ncbi:MAG: hypothetical protein GY926_17975 [bacterium]|nr:hypothetical protein [bacterium]
MKRTPIDPDDFAWGDLCDQYGTPYRIGDQFRLAELEALPGMPDLEAMLGPTTILWLETPPDDHTETDYVTGRPLDSNEIGGWTHYKLRELTTHRGTRATPAEVLRMIDESESTEPWVDKARAAVGELADVNGGWTCD